MSIFIEPPTVSRWPADVRCPACGAKAGLDHIGQVYRLVCAQCAAVREWGWRDYAFSKLRGEFEFTSHGQAPAHTAAPRAEVVPLWLRTGCLGHVLWAVNAEHLAYLRDFVAADIRKSRSYSGVVKPWSAKFPGWITSAKHREQVTSRIAALELLAGAGA